MMLRNNLPYFINNLKVDEIIILPHVFGEDARMELIELIANELIPSCSRDEF